MKLISEPYTLELRHDVKDSEKNFRRNLNLEWCDGILFNVTAVKNIPLAEYDVIQWNELEKQILFIEYKNSHKAYKNLKAHEATQKKDYALNIARAFGFLEYTFIIVVKDIEQNAEKVKGKADVISLDELTDYSAKFESTLEELHIVNNLLSKYEQQENQGELIKRLKDLKNKIEQVNVHK